MITDIFIMKGYVCMPKNLLDVRLVEEYLASLHCYLPSMWYCKLLEKRPHSHHEITNYYICTIRFFAQFDLLL